MQVADPNISKRKFQEEIEKYLSVEETQRKRGVFLLKAEYPNVILLLTAPNLIPSPIVFAVIINFDNYDLEPLSVRFINPFTWELLKVAPIPMLRKSTKKDGSIEIQNLAQKDITGLPFICIAGIREYHNHPAHTGDSWLLHRNKGGEGCLGFIIEKLYEYGISAVASYQLQIAVQVPQVQVFYDPNLFPE